MIKIGSVTNTANGSGEFAEGSGGAGVPSTLIRGAWLNAVQRELVNAIEGLGIALDPEDDSQLLQALQKLAGETAEWAGIKHVPQALLGLSRITSLSTSATLSADQLGMVLIDASAAARTITLPTSNFALGVVDVIVRRTDNSGNRLVVQAAGADKIKFHTHLSPAGYPFMVLMGAGDWWHLRSDGAGGWLPIGRHDNTPLGRPVFETTAAFQPGGWAGINGFIYNRTEWPWVWDHAQASGMLTTDAMRTGNEGCWTSGDGALTFRIPELRGGFLRMLSESSTIDTGRGGGTSQASSNLSHDHGATRAGFMSNEFPNSQGTMGSGGVVTYAGQGVQMAKTASSGGTESRPYNIAYPGRLKMI